MKFGSLFAGIGGFDLGLERAGMECAWQVEIDEYCLKVLEKHWPSVSRYTDVRECGRDNLEPVDLICGGFPCQPYSYAGKRKGSADDRNLWPEFLRIVRELRPTWVVGENVPGIVPMYLDQVLSDLEGEAYSCWPFNIPACAFDAPHRRERIWIVAHAEGYLRGTPRGYRSKSLDGSDSLLAYAEPIRRGEMEQPIITGTNGKGTADTIANSGITTRGGWWKVESGLGGMVDGISPWLVEPRDIPRTATRVENRKDRLRAVGNAVVPQVAEFIGRRIKEGLDEKETV